MENIEEINLYHYLLDKIKKEDFTKLKKAVYLDDVQILKLLEALTRSTSATKNSFEILISCFNSEEIFMFMMTRYQSCFQNHNIFNRLTIIYDDELKMHYLKKIKNPTLKILISLSIENLTLRRRLMSHYTENELYEFCKKSNNTEVIFRLLTYIPSHQTECSEKTIGIKATPEENEIVEEILLLPTTKEKVNVIRENIFSNNILYHILHESKNTNIKAKLIEHFYRLKNMDIFKSDYCKHFDIKEYHDALPPELLFGIEIECIGDNARPLKYYSSKILDYHVKDDWSIYDGIEFASPKLSWQKSDLESIYQVCDFAKSNNLYVDARCGGHIHFSRKYLRTYAALYCLFYLYSKFESIIFMITNKPYELPREEVTTYAQPFSKIYTDNLNILDNITDPEYFIYTIKNLYKKRAALNLSDHDTIEFRMPNASLNPNVIMENVLLLGNLIVLARKMSMLPMTKEMHSLIHSLDTPKTEREKLEILLELLFKDKNTQNIFRKRYIKNKLNNLNSLRQKLEKNTSTFNLSDRKISF